MEEGQLFVWLRLGSEAGYEHFNDLDELIEHLRRYWVRGPFRRRGEFGGVTAPGYQGYNYISIYYGGVHAQPVHKLTDEEIEAINRQL